MEHHASDKPTLPDEARPVPTTEKPLEWCKDTWRLSAAAGHSS